MNKFLYNNIETIKKNREMITISQELLNEYDKDIHTEGQISFDGFMIGSSVDQAKCIDVWCNQFGKLSEIVIPFIFGLSDMDYFVEFRNRYPESVFLVYAPSDELLLGSLSRADYTELLADDKFVLCAGERKFDILYSFLNRNFDADCIYDIEYAFIPNFVKIFDKEFDVYQNAIYEVLESKYMTRNTLIEQENVRLDNYLNNLNWIYKSSNLKNIREALNGINLDEYPAVIVATGPSLDKNVDLLKELKGKACVFCLDASIKTLNTRCIRPDVLLSVDPNFKKDSFEAGIGHDVPLVYHIVGNRGVVQSHDGKKILVSDIDYYLDSLLAKYNEKVYPLESGGSVAHNAFSMATQLGFKRIILIGQDLGFPDNKQHAQGAFENEDDVEVDSTFYYVDAVDGGKVLTSLQMDHYKKWIENQISKNPDVHVIDATEGGALIKGTEIMTFRAAIDEYCKAADVDFEALFKNAHNIVEGKAADDLKADINKTFEDIDANIKKMEKVKREYYTLRALNDKGKYKTSEFKKTFQSISDFSVMIEENAEYMLYKMCCSKAHYNSLDAMTQEFDNPHDEINEIIKQGLVMIDEYIEAGNRLKKEWGRVVSENN